MTVEEHRGVEAPSLPSRRLHPASPFIGLVFQLRQLILPLGLSFLIGRDDGETWPTLLLLIAPLVLALIQFLEWTRFTYRIEGGALIVDSGFFNRRHREIPVDRVHHVEEIAKLQHRVFGVVKLQIDSGGGESGAEVGLDALSRREAATLRAFLEGRPESPRPIISREDGGAAPIARAGVGSLVIAGVTNVPLAATVGVVGTVLQFADELGGDFFYELVESIPPTVTGLGIIAGVFAVLYVAAAGGASVLTNYGFTLQRDGHELRTQRGLLDRRRAVVDLGKLTVIRLEETIMRRALGLCSLRLQTISGGGGSNAVSSLTVPILERSEVDRVVAELMPVASPLPELETHPRAARRRLYARRLVISAALAIPVAWFWRPVGLVVAGLLMALAACRSEVAYRALGHATRGGVLVSRAGGLRRETSIAAWSRAESTRVRSSPLQRWAGLATLYVDVPQGKSVAVADAGPAELAQLRRLAITGSATPPGCSPMEAGPNSISPQCSPFSFTSRPKVCE